MRRRLVILAIPLIVGQLGAILQSFADTIMVGQYGTLELSASGFVNQVFNLVIYFLLGISYGATPVIGSMYGRGDKGGVWQTLLNSIRLGLIVSLAVVALLVLFYFKIDSLGQPVELLPFIRPYFLLQLASMPTLAIFNAAKQYYDAVGDTRTPMWVMLAANMLNIVLNYLLIFGTFGCPEWGLTGAGVATLAARFSMMAAMLWLLWKKRKANNTSSDTMIRPRIEGSQMALLALGLPIAIQLCLEASSFNISALFMGWLGVAPLAAHQVMCTISTLYFQVVYGIGAAASVMVSQAHGRNDWNTVRLTVKTAYVMSLVSAFTLVSITAIAFQPISSLFTTSQEVKDVLASLLPLLFIYLLGDCTQILFANVLRGLGAVRHMMIHAFIAYIVVSLPLSYILAFPCGMGSVGVWCGMPVGLTTAGILFWTEYRRNMKVLTATNK